MAFPYLIPIVAALLFRAGGTDQWPWCSINQKLWRWLMGLVIGALLWKGWVAYGLCVAGYFIATNVFSYGEKSPILKYLPKWARFAVSGLAYGLAGFALLGLNLAIIQGIVGAVAYLVLMVLDDKEIVKNPYQELLRGALGTIMFLAVK